ncbi:MAG: uracil-DNA glycosylase [Parvibaculum sp.]|uniref:uracil-DNA glycosylase n=1 Tax=Parvibaculum sp. TaxID=2024848 RepID=UPI003C788AB9
MKALQQWEAEPPHDCPLCPRLVAFRQANRAAHPDWFNGPVPSFGSEKARLLIVGLAPGLQGANRTGRPFTGDYAGDLLYSTLIEFGFAKGAYAARPDDGLTLIDAMITNAVRCVPPQNKPTPLEARTCLPFFSARIAALPRLKAVLALGRIAHDSVLIERQVKRTQAAFAHQASHDIGGGVRLFDSYHCSRYNTNTGRLTTEMFHAVFRDIRAFLDKA